MKARHMEGHPYTRTGDIVIAINPFQWFTHLYTEEKCQYYSNRLVWVDSDNDPRDGMEPHVYEVSALSYKGLAFGGLDQSILVSGESGAGKTETVKIAMSHMASVQKGPGKKGGSQELDPVVKRVVESNPLLEAFGNAKTRRNDNSSRFGKYLQLQFDNSEAHLMGFGDKTESKCKLAGSKCDVYLLEKNRVVGHDSEGERTYHIFYQLLAAPEDEKAKIWSKLKGQNTSSYKYIGHNECNTIEGMSDAQHWQKTRDTLELIDVKGEKLVGMMRAIAAVMLLGNVEFEKKGGDADKSAVKTKDAIHDLAGLMHVDEEQLSLSFTERTMKTKTEEYKVPLKPDAAKDACDALAKEIYGKVFLWLVRAINAATCAEDNYKDGSMSKFGIIGLLDIFGFESFVVNRFEQLCINYANEKLQQKFTEDIFRSVQEEYESEGIELAEIWYDDNTDVLDLIEGRTGLLALLNEECVRPKGNDEQFVQKALQMNGKSPCMITNKMDRMSFGIHHYAGKVMYDADQFVSRNQDTLPIDLGDLCKLSDNYVISAKIDEMADMEAPSNSRAPRRAKSNLIAPTVWGKYKTQLASLMGNLRKTNSRYIRCIKPNMAKKPVLMEHVPTVEQLRCAGVVAAVTLSRSAFPNRLENQVTRYRYGSQWDGAKYPSKRRPGMTPEEMLSADCDAILECALKEKEIRDGDKVIRMFVVGKTRSYFRAGALEYLEANRLENGLDEPATQIQKIGRGWLLRRKLNDLTSGAREAERLRLEEEERKKMAELELKAAADREAKLELERRKKAEAIRKAKAEQEAKEKAERLELKKREREERERIEAEEESAREKVKNMKKEIRKLEKKLDDFKVAAERKIRDAEEEAEELEQEQVELKKKYEEIMKAAASVDKGEINANKKKIEESEMIVTYLRKENKKTRDKTDKMKEDLQDLKEQNNRLIEANASAGASLDSLEKQKVNLQSHNTKLEENLKKYKTQNNQLKADLDNRNAYLKAEAKIKDEYQRALEQIIELMENRCDDGKLVEDVTAAQLQCEAIATHKVGQLSHLDL
jgi:myosin-5